VDLARLLNDLIPAERGIRGLLALLVLNHVRRFTRTGTDGRLLLLEDQDRSAWDRAAIAEGNRMVAEAFRFGNPGRFTLQASIAAAHATAPSFAETDWDSIVAGYDRLLEVWPSPVVALNRATVLSMARGPEEALVEIEHLRGDERLSRYHYLPAIEADLLRRLDRHDEAAVAYRRALDLVRGRAGVSDRPTRRVRRSVSRSRTRTLGYHATRRTASGIRPPRPPSRTEIDPCGSTAKSLS